MMISTLMSGYSRRSGASFGNRTVSVAFSVAVIRMVPAGFSRSSADRVELGLDLLKAWADVAEQSFARLCRRDAARRAGQEPEAEPLLEASHRVAQCGLRDAELGGGFGEATLPRDRQEGDQVVDVGARHL